MFKSKRLSVFNGMDGESSALFAASTRAGHRRAFIRRMTGGILRHVNHESVDRSSVLQT